MVIIKLNKNNNKKINIKKFVYANNIDIKLNLIMIIKLIKYLCEQT